MWNNLILYILITLSTLLSLASYIPQLVKLLKTKESAGISILAWVISVLGLIAYFLYAIFSNDIKLAISMGISLLMGSLILILAIKYDRRG